MCVIATQTWSLRTADPINWILEHRHVRRRSTIAPWGYAVPLYEEYTRVLQTPGSLGQHLACFALGV